MTGMWTNRNGNAGQRERIIIMTSAVGILANTALAAVKAVIGLLTHSIAITLDAVNNLSDALSSIITIIGARLSNKAPDRKHPLGHGRIEYLSAALVSSLILYAGITSLVESVKKIITPVKADYSVLSLVILVLAIVVKLILGRYVKKQGERVNSGALTASGADASFDAVLSASVLFSALLYLGCGISVEAWVGAGISLAIIKSGLDMMTDTLDDILGHRVDTDVSMEIKRLIMEEPEVQGVHDLIVFNYGPDRDYASVHIELPDTMTAAEIDRLTRRLEKKVYRATGIILTGVGLYSMNTGSAEAERIRSAVEKLVLAHGWAKQIHGFYLDTEERAMRFDVVISFDVTQAEARNVLLLEVGAAFPDYSLEITMDMDISD